MARAASSERGKLRIFSFGRGSRAVKGGISLSQYDDDMGWARTLLLGDIGNRLDIEDAAATQVLLGGRRVEQATVVVVDDVAQLQAVVGVEFDGGVELGHGGALGLLAADDMTFL